MVDQLLGEVAKDKVDEYFTALGLVDECSTGGPDSLLDPAPDREKVAAILASLDTDTSGDLSGVEVKELFSKLLEIAIDDIPDDHEEVVKFTELDHEARIQMVCDGLSKAHIDGYYDEMMAKKAQEDEEAAAAAAAIEAAAATAIEAEAEAEAGEEEASPSSTPEPSGDVVGEEDGGDTETVSSEYTDTTESISGVSVSTKSVASAWEGHPGRSLLAHQMPDRYKVEMIVRSLTVDGEGEVQIDQIRRLFSKLLGVPEQLIPETHEELVAFRRLDKGAMVRKLCYATSVGQVEAYYDEMFADSGISGGASFLELQIPDRQKVKKIVKSLEVDEQRHVLPHEVAGLFSRLLRIAPEEISEEHDEVFGPNPNSRSLGPSLNRDPK